ncbi:putative transcription factor interactor and regulator CCHC(Zn) family [Helianthus anomalus]
MVGGAKRKVQGSHKKNQILCCPWILHVSNPNNEGTWVVKTFINEHTCFQTRDVKLCTMSYLAKQIEDTIAVNPSIPILALQDQVQKKFQVQVSLQKIFRAKLMATQKVDGDYQMQYSLLRDYVDELMRSNPGTTVKLEVEKEPNPASLTRQFKRIYICLGALKTGFKMCGRDILGLDGCFMKGPYPGQILTAVGVDSNNGIYPVAYALVEAETTSSWTWFLECLGGDLDLNVNSNFTFITDRQKGILPALAKVYPSAEHRYCLRHIHENMKSTWRGSLYKNLLWKCASVSTIPQFERAMNQVYMEDIKLHDWLRQIPPQHWTRSHFSGRAKSDVLLNNLCEVFNSQLVGGRDKPIITCLEYIREYLMKRIVLVHKVIAKCDGPLTPKATELFETIKSEASQCSVIYSGNNKYQVSRGIYDQCVVNINQRNCTCRKWELTGLPCRHAVAVIWNMTQHGQDVGIPESWVSEVYWIETWKKVYANTIDGVNGVVMWTPSQCPITLRPPKHHKQVGRPKKKRKKSAEELSQPIVKNGKMIRVGSTVTCTKCKGKGHNQRSCKGDAGHSQKTARATSKSTARPAPQSKTAASKSKTAGSKSKTDAPKSKPDASSGVGHQP